MNKQYQYPSVLTPNTLAAFISNMHETAPGERFQPPRDDAISRGWRDAATSYYNDLHPPNPFELAFAENMHSKNSRKHSTSAPEPSERAEYKRTQSGRDLHAKTVCIGYTPNGQTEIHACPDAAFRCIESNGTRVMVLAPLDEGMHDVAASMSFSNGSDRPRSVISETSDVSEEILTARSIKKRERNRLSAWKSRKLQREQECNAVDALKEAEKTNLFLKNEKNRLWDELIHLKHELTNHGSSCGCQIVNEYVNVSASFYQDFQSMHNLRSLVELERELPMAMSRPPIVPPDGPGRKRKSKNIDLLSPIQEIPNRMEDDAVAGYSRYGRRIRKKP